MIKKLSILILFFSSIHLAGQESKLNWYDDVSKAIPVAVAKKKPIMLFSRAAIGVGGVCD